MVHSTWGDWFVTEAVEGVELADGASAWYLGCNGFVLRSAAATVYIDPYFGEGDPPGLIRMIPVPVDPTAATTCDAVLCTHEHIDHVHPPSYGPLVEDLGAKLCAPEASFGPDRDYAGDLRAPEDQRRVIAVGDTFDVGDFTIHVRGANDPDAVEPVSYVVEHPSGTFFHGGDSRPAEAFGEIGREFDLDLGVLAFGTVGRIYHAEDDSVRPTRWYMDENDVVEAANALQLDRLVPSHWDMWKGVTGDAKALHEHAASYPYPRVVERVTIGDRVAFAEPGIVSPRLG